MRTEQIEQRLQDINNEIQSLDSLKNDNDDVNIHMVDSQVDSLLQEKYKLTVLLESYFNDMIGL